LTLLNARLPGTAAEAEAAAPLDLIFIEGLTLHTVIGVHVSEFGHTQPLLMDVRAGVAHARACHTDAIGDTIDYGVVRERLHRLAREHGVQTLEAFAELTADILLGEFGAQWVHVKVVKPRKFDDVQAVGVEIERTAARHARSAAVLTLIGSGMVPPAPARDD
jgi:dihydroneopterin aldolase